MTFTLEIIVKIFREIIKLNAVNIYQRHIKKYNLKMALCPPMSTVRVAGCQEVGTCSTRGESQGTYITFDSAMRISQPTLALKPRGDVTRNPKQGYQWPQNRTQASAKKTLKKTAFKQRTFLQVSSLAEK